MQGQPTVVATTKSPGIAILLTILFGPLGMLYSTVGGGCLMTIIAVILAILTFPLGGIGAIIIWPICIIWGALAASAYNKRILHQWSGTQLGVPPRTVTQSPPIVQPISPAQFQTPAAPATWSPPLPAPSPRPLMDAIIEDTPAERPVPPPPAESPPPAPPAREPPMEKRFVCTCGQRLSIPPHLRGKRGRCPKCKREFFVDAEEMRPF